MIDRAMRDRAALLLRRFAAGRLTNDAFVDTFPTSKIDPALQAVEERAWALYSDLRTHRLTGGDALTPAGMREVSRWVLFLQSDVEYAWPTSYSFIQIYNWPLNLLTLGWWERRKAEKFRAFAQTGDFEVWPFGTRAEYDAVVCHPRFLAGGNAA